MARFAAVICIAFLVSFAAASCDPTCKSGCSQLADIAKKAGQDYDAVYAQCIQMLCPDCKSTLSIFGAPLTAPSPVTFTACDKNTPIFKVNQITVDPFPVVKGQDANMVLSGEMTQDQSISTVDVITKLVGVQLDKTTVTVTDDVAAGSYSLPVKSLIRSEAPPNTYQVFFHVNNDQNVEIACIKIDLKIN